MPFQVWTVIASIVAIITLVWFVPSMNHHVSPYVIWSFLDSRAIWTSPLISSKSDGKFLKELQIKMLTIWVVWRKLASVIVSAILLLIIIVRIIYQVEWNSFISTMSILNVTLQTMLGITSVTTFTTRKRFFSSVYDHMSLNFRRGLHNASTVRTTILLRSKFDRQEQNLKERKIWKL